MPAATTRIRTIGLLILGLSTLCPNAVWAKKAEAYIAGNYVEGSPTPSICTESDAPAQARALAATIPGAFVVRGRGNSMLPLYSSGTWLVVRPVAFEQLSRGMSVVFRSNDKVITHVLVAKTGDGWRTTGLNNRRHDFVPVTANNIRGVVIAAFTPLEGKMMAMR